ncbi:hypothetical protein HRM2_24940 [Desulforapulum autotrophicum HRM2]|uniref:Uncharacterized protein n=1 Tax=Desulforapulum autotrophicum (strain ATCC 43914 / DSM 3382 / VKM B-1955 / HRM2) TaxID=177437 RepID=C0QGT9_DESAH|nr:hypothetical protein [Desulforapulum autotrophicum]ACN15588.1 hypothetical protein HRM2_24940 [Desulforapulum autotrophicum HRM2]
MYYEAVYTPKETKGLGDKALKFVGKRIALQDGGQEELTPGKSTVVYIASPNFGLIPNHDLTKITSIPLNKWNMLAEQNKLLL